MPPERRQEDTRVAKLEDEVKALEIQMAELKASMKTASWLTTFFGAVIFGIITWVTTHTPLLNKIFGVDK